MTKQTATYAARFSQQIAGGAPCFPFWKGRVALYAILKALGIAPGDEVVVPGYTCVMNINPVKYCGACPIYVDIDPKTYNVDPGRVEAAITPRTRVIIAQHTYGIPCDMDVLLAIGKKHGVPVIEDCCLALGSTYKGRLCGTMGVAAYWSFQWSKTVTTGIGGMAAVNDPVLAEKVRVLCAQAQNPSLRTTTLLDLQRLAHRFLLYPKTAAFATALFRWLTAKGVVIGSSSSQEFNPVEASDFFMGMSAGQARAGLRGLSFLEKNRDHRLELLKLYEDELKGKEALLPQPPVGSVPVYVRYPVRVKDKQSILKEAVSRRMEIGSWFESPLHPHETPLAPYNYTLGQCPEAERAAREVVNLPLHPRVTRTEAERSVRFIAEHLAGE